MAGNLEIDVNKVIGKLHAAAVENAKKATDSFMSKLFGNDISKMMVNTGITTKGDEPVFCGAGNTYEIILLRKGSFNLDRCRKFLQEYMKWFAGDSKFNIDKYNVKPVQSKKKNTRYFKFEYKVVEKKLQAKGGKKPVSEDYYVKLMETGNNTETSLNTDNVWLNKYPFGVN